MAKNSRAIKSSGLVQVQASPHTNYKSLNSMSNYFLPYFFFISTVGLVLFIMIIIVIVKFHNICKSLRTLKYRNNLTAILLMLL